MVSELLAPMVDAFAFVKISLKNNY